MLGRLCTPYDRPEPRYARLALLGPPPAAYPTGAGERGHRARYADVSLSGFARLVVASRAPIWTPDVLLEARLMRPRARSEVTEGIDRTPVDPDLEVQVRAERVPGVPDVAHHVALADRGAAHRAEA